MSNTTNQQNNQAFAKFNLPDLLKEQHNWLVWRLTQKPNLKKPSKIPHYASGKLRFGEQGADADRAALVSFNEAMAAAEAGGYSGVGMALLPGCDIVALDFDDCVVDGRVTVPFIKNLATVTYTELSPSGTGIRSFMRGYLPSKKDVRPASGDFSVEIFGDSGFVTVTGNVLDDCLLFGTDTVVANLTDEVLELYRSRFGNVAANSSALTVVDSVTGEVTVGVGNGVEDENDAWLMGLKHTLGWTLDEARGYLNDCEAGCDRDHWVKAGMAIHYELDGSDDGLTIYDEWSSKGANYAGISDVRGRYRSFGKQRIGGGQGQITGAWLLSWRTECLKRKTYAATEAWKKEIKSAGDEYTLRESVAPKIRNDSLLGRVEREALAQALLDAFKALGTKYPIGEVRKMLTPKKIVVDSELPDYFNGVVYITATDRFYCKNTMEYLTVQGFNSKFNRFMPRDEHGNVEVSAHVAALEQYQVPVCKQELYVPWLGEFFDDPFNHGDKPATFVNSFSPLTIPRESDSLDAEGVLAVERVTKHIETVLCGGRKHIADLLISFLAYNVQNPGKRVLWMPLIKGIEGDGKSLLFSLMAAVLGVANTKTVSPTVLTTDFTGWAEGSCFTVFEELRLQGHNRHDVHNRIKPFITNPIVNIHKKGRDAYDALNTTNYLAVTNSKNALPLSNVDRRFMVIFTPFESRTELDALLAAYGGSAQYFTELHDSIGSCGAQLRRWLLDYKLADDFNPNGTAPVTDEKERMIASSISDESQLIQEILDAGGMGISRNAFISSVVRDQLTMSHEGANISNNQFNFELQKLGWEKFPKRVFFNGKTEILWVRGGATWDEKTRNMLQGTENVENLFL